MNKEEIFENYLCKYSYRKTDVFLLTILALGLFAGAALAWKSSVKAGLSWKKGIAEGRAFEPENAAAYHRSWKDTIASLAAVVAGLYTSLVVLKRVSAPASRV